MITIEKKLDGDFVILTVKAKGLADKKIAVLAEAIYDETTSLEEQEALAKADAERRIAIRDAISRMI